MKLKRRQKGVIVEVNPIEDTIKQTPVFEDFIQESLFKRLIKDKKILVDLFASIWFLFWLFIYQNKYVVISFTACLSYYLDSLIRGIKYHRNQS